MPTHFMIKNANKNFEESVPSDELYLTIDIQNEEMQEAEEQRKYEKNYLRDRISGETGVEILWRESFLEMFVEKADTIYQTFHDLFYWDSRFSFSSLFEIEDIDETWQPLFSVCCNADEKCYIEVQISITIDDEMDGDSVINFLLIEIGIAPLAISERLGHEDIRTTLNTYSHLYPNKQSEIAQKLECFLE